MLRRRHRVAEGREMADAERLFAQHRRQLQRDLLADGERALRADQQRRQIVRRAVRRERVDIIAADPARHVRETGADLLGLAGAELQQAAGEGGKALLVRGQRRRPLDGREARLAAVRHQRVDGLEIVAHHAVADRARAAAIIRRHAPERRPRAGRDVDRKPQAGDFERAVQLVEHQARLDNGRRALRIDAQDFIEMLGKIDDDRCIDRLPALRGPAAPRQHRHALLAGDGQHRFDILKALRHDDAEREHLIDRGVCGIASAVETGDEHVALDGAAQFRFEAAADLIRCCHCSLRSQRTDCVISS